MKKAGLSLLPKGFFTHTTMKLWLAIFAFGILSPGVFAAKILASKQEIGMYKNSKTCVVLENGINLSNALFHFHVGPPEQAGAGKCFEMIFDTSGNLYYYNYRMITNDNEDGFNLADFRRINQ